MVARLKGGLLYGKSHFLFDMELLNNPAAFPAMVVPRVELWHDSRDHRRIDNVAGFSRPALARSRIRPGVAAQSEAMCD